MFQNVNCRILAEFITVKASTSSRKSGIYNINQLSAWIQNGHLENVTCVIVNNVNYWLYYEKCVLLDANRFEPRSGPT